MTDPSIPCAAKWAVYFDDGGERLTVSYDQRDDYWRDKVKVVANESDDSSVHVDLGDARWLAARLIDAAIAMEARRAETPQDDSVHDSAAIAQTPSSTATNNKDESE